MDRNDPSPIDYVYDPDRVDALERLEIVDTDREETFDDLSRLAAKISGVELAQIHLLDDQREWVKAASCGTRPKAQPAHQSVCAHTIQRGDILVIPDLSQDERFHTRDFVTGPGGLRFYAGAPLRTCNGHSVGTFCLLDREPRPELSDRELDLLREFASAAAHVIELRQAHQRAERNLHQVVTQDALTDVMTRTGLLLALQRRGGDGEEPQSPLTIIELRLQRIDAVKWAYGTARSNRVLIEAARRLRALASHNEMVARIDDMTFVVVRTTPQDGDPPSQVAIEQRARAILERLREPFLAGDTSFYVEPVAGIGQLPRHASDPYTLLDVAHEAALRAESSTGDRLCWSDASKAVSQREKLSLEARVREAIANDGFSIALQPIVELQSANRCAGAELLVRWPDSGDPPIGPATFIPLIEELDLIGDLGRSVFVQACESLARLQREHRSDFWLAVNLSPLQLQDATLPRTLAAIARDKGVAPESIKLEVTESALVDDFDRAARVLHELTDVGFALSLDDFGTGHSSLSRLIHLPFSTIKVDRSFVWDSPDGPGAAVVVSLVGLASSLRMATVAEGVEDEAHESFLCAQGYTYGQGFRYARPQPHASFCHWLVGQEAGGMTH